MARKKRKLAEINSSSSADIAFLLLIFFLITTSMDTDKGLARRLPPPVPKDQQDQDVDIKKRNLFEVRLNQDTKMILAGGEFVALEQLKDKAKEFIVNANDDAHLPEKLDVEIPYFGNVKITKNHIISLQNTVDTPYWWYIAVQNELAKAYNELREDVSKQKFGKSFEELNDDEKDAVIKYYPQKISEAEPKKHGGKK